MSRYAYEHAYEHADSSSYEQAPDWTNDWGTAADWEPFADDAYDLALGTGDE